MTVMSTGRWVGTASGPGKEKQEVHPRAWAGLAAMTHDYHTLVLILLFIDEL